MSQAATKFETVTLDLSDVKVRVGQETGGGELIEGDVTYLDAVVWERVEESIWGAPLVRLDVKMTNQDGSVLATGTADVELPR